MQKPVTNIIFDLGKVLVPFDWEIAFSKLSFHVPREITDLIKNDRALFISLFSDSLIDLEKGLISFENFFDKLRQTFSLDAPLLEFRKIWCDIFWVNQEVIELGRNLSSQYPCWLMSNTSQAHYEWIIEKFPSVLFYRKAALSYELGEMKPDRQYYVKAIDLFGIDPVSAIFIDDIQENLDGAAVLGIRTILFENVLKLRWSLKEHGVTL